MLVEMDFKVLKNCRYNRFELIITQSNNNQTLS